MSLARLNALVAAIEGEITAIDKGDYAALDRATRAKLGAVETLRRAPPVPLPADVVARAAALNLEAARRVNRARARIERRLAALARASGRGTALVYGADGRPVLGALLG